jgi:mannose-1-phosphate guanylyltransferase/mannose-6-phosphate isomerase
MPAPIVPVILAGGTGTRLWPLSRDSMPKQFMAFQGARTAYQDTLLRVAAPMFAPPIVVTGADFRFMAHRQAEEVGVRAQVVIEPMRRDSAAAVTAGTLIAWAHDANAVVLALAADHIILDADAFRTTCAAGLEAARAGHIVTFGMAPTAPKTAYGYIRPGAKIGTSDVRKVERFVEKPDSAAAERCVADGYLWNSGNFLFRADAMIEEMSRHQPDVVSAVENAIKQATNDLGFLRLDADAFAASPQTSVDYAVMEKTDRAAVVRGDFRWSDIGSWDALAEILPSDHDRNVVLGPVVRIDSTNCIIHANDRLVAAVGVQDLIIVSTADAVMVVPRSRAQEVRDLVDKLKELKRPEADTHRRVDRPWGYYETLDVTDRFQVKRIVVNPGGMLSLQMHQHRAEHWVVVRGTADITVGEETRTLNENQSLYIPSGTVHRLANTGATPLELIEVQTGNYLGDDDIVRLDDIYRRD